MDDVGKRRWANWRSCVETERDAGLEVARKWAKEDDKYRALLRIARAVEEARSRDHGAAGGGVSPSDRPGDHIARPSSMPNLRASPASMTIGGRHRSGRLADRARSS